MNRYELISGKWTSATGDVLGIGCSGGDCGLDPYAVNNPGFQFVHNVGPIPVGIYTINPPQDTVTHGPFVLPLTPSPANLMWGRSGFLCHGDSVILPGKRAASDGCIILPRNVRQQIWDSGDLDLQVV